MICAETPQKGFDSSTRHGPVGLFDGLDDGILVERADRAEIDDLGTDPVLGLEGSRQLRGSAGRCDSVGDEGDVAAFALDVGFSERDDVKSPSDGSGTWPLVIP